MKLINARLRHYHDLGISIGSPIGSAIGSGQRGSSRVEMAAIGAVDASMDLEQQRRDFVAIIARAEQVIRAVPQEKYRQILYYRYLCDWSYRSISDELGYNDPRSIYRSHKWALIAAQEILNKMGEGKNGNATE